MNKPILALIILTLLLISGCNSSYKDCSQSCYWDFKDEPKFKYNSSCDDRTIIEVINGTESNYVDCKKIDYDEVDRFCFNECKPK